MTSDFSIYSATIRSLLSAVDAGSRAMPLTPETALDSPQLEILQGLSLGELFFGQEIADTEYAQCVHAGLYLYFSALDESHSISQQVSSASGSYWHGIMHRQEGDWSNAKYWFRRTGEHPVMEKLGQETSGTWDPFHFVDRCESAVNTRTGQEELIGLQQLEWQFLMQYCYQHALDQ